MSSAIGVLILFVSLCGWAVAKTDWVSFKQNHVNLAPTVPRIIGGDETPPHAFPYIAGLLINGNAFCGGTLISENYVLTAAHCGAVIFDVDVILGAHNVTDEESTQVRIKGEKTIVHEGFTYVDYQNDIALVKLAEPAPINDYIKLATLPSRSAINTTYENDSVVSIGWGISSDVYRPTIRDMSQDLRYVNVEVISVEECADYYKDEDTDIVYVTEKNICTSGYKNKGTCNGDSGGPLVENDVQIGLVSIGTDLCEICSPSIFTNVVKFLDWIEDNSDVVIV